MADAPASETRSLDDVLLAMDVVDTLRHRARVVDHELDAEAREAQLIARLREIYAAQGIEVPDRILKDGVKALEERRFVYEPPPPSFSTRLATLYVTRGRWGRPVAVIVGVIVAALLALQIFVLGPRDAQARADEAALSRTIPRDLAEVRAEIAGISEDPEALAIADALSADVEAAIAAEDPRAAEAALAKLETLKADLLAVYELRIVSRPGEFTGFFRVPEGRPGVRNYYVVVEPVDPAGRVLAAPITSEEDQSTRRASLFAIRIDEAAFDRIKADKEDDQIVQDAIVGRKARGELRPSFSIDATGAAIFEW